MTNEEAIAIIRNEYKCVDRDCDIERSCGKCDLMMPNKEPILKAYEMAIQALLQEPCDDMVSREAVIEWLENATYEDICEAVGTNLDFLPSVTQKLETVTEFADRCRECGKMRKGHWIWNFDKGYCKCSECGIGMGHKEFDYCPNCGAKMQESEDKE